MNGTGIVEIPPAEHPIWDLYDLQRDSRFYTKLYGLKAHRLESAIFWTDVVTTIFAGSSAVAGFAFWKDPTGHQLWVVGTAIAAVLAAIKPLMQLPTKLKTYQELYFGYAGLDLDCDALKIRIHQAREYNKVFRDAVIAIKDKERAVAVKAPPQKEDAPLVERIYAQVNKELTDERFYLPPLTGDDREHGSVGTSATKASSGSAPAPASAASAGPLG